MGAGGIYYRATLPASSPNARRSGFTEPGAKQPDDRASESTGHGPMIKIESASASEIRDSSSEDLLREIQERHSRFRLAPGVIALGALGVVVALAYGHSVLAALAVVATVAAGGAALYRDKMVKTVVLLYDLEPVAQRDCAALVRALEVAGSCNKVWNVDAQAKVYDQKRNAGATSVIRRDVVRIRSGPPPFVKTNVPVPVLPAGEETLYFFPDRVLVYTSRGVGALSYGALNLTRRETRFIEEGGVPRDAKVVDRTWRFVNKGGGPDRRFKDNHEIPIALYEEAHFSGHGLNEVFQFSRLGALGDLERALMGIARYSSARAT